MIIINTIENNLEREKEKKEKEDDEKTKWHFYFEETINFWMCGTVNN